LKQYDEDYDKNESEDSLYQNSSSFDALQKNGGGILDLRPVLSHDNEIISPSSPTLHIASNSKGVIPKVQFHTSVNC